MLEEHYPYGDFHPQCWIYRQYGGNHGWEDLADALRDSCNIYFYTLGHRLGIDKIDEYAAMFGLGQKTGLELSEAEDISVIVIGGNFRHRILSCVGAYAEEMMKTLFFDKGFISGNHLTLEHGFTTPDLQEARMKRLMMASCKEHYIALDYSKFGDDSLGLIASISDLDGIVTDWRTPKDFVEQLRDRGVNVVQGKEIYCSKEVISE